MQVIRFGQGKLMFGAVLAAFATLAMLWLFFNAEGWMGGVGLFAGLAASIACAGMIVKLSGDRVAIEFDRKVLKISTLWSKRTVTWDEVCGVHVERLTQKLYGVIPVWSIRFLTFRVMGGIGTKKIRVQLGLLEPGKAEMDRLIQTLRSLSVGGEVDLQPASASGAPADAPIGGDFDPDAAMARYLARREPGGPPVTGTAPTPSRVPTINGKPVRPTAPAMPDMPARPAFGRRGL